MKKMKENVKINSVNSVNSINDENNENKFSMKKIFRFVIEHAYGIVGIIFLILSFLSTDKEINLAYTILFVISIGIDTILTTIKENNELLVSSIMLIILNEDELKKKYFKEKKEEGDDDEHF